MTLSQARRLAVLSQVQMVGPIVLDGFGFKRLKFAVGATASQVNELIEDLERQGEVLFGNATDIHGKTADELLTMLDTGLVDEADLLTLHGLRAA